MNILIFANYGSVYKGNFIQSVQVLEKKLISEGNTVHWMFPEKARKSDWIKEMKSHGSALEFLHLSSIGQTVSRIRNYVKANQINVVHIHFIDLKIMIMFRIALLGISGITYRIHLHNHYPVDTGVKKLLRKWSEKDCVFLCCSYSVAQDLLNRGYPNEKVITVENCIEFSRLDIINEDAYCKSVFFNNRWKLMMFGFDYERKGVDLALKAVSAINRERVYQVQLYISLSSNRELVKGKIKETFQGEIPEWITLLEPRNDIATYYNRVDAFLSASREEGFCYALLEAAYRKVQLIASWIPAQNDLLIPECFWFESGNADDLKIKIEECIREPKSKPLLEKQKQVIVQHYNLNEWANKVVCCYSNSIIRME